MVRISYKKILVATDGSDYSKEVVDYGIDLAKSTEAKLFAIYVIDTRAYSSIPLSEPLEYAISLLRQEGEMATGYVVDRAKAEGEEVETTIAQGHPADEILKYAEKNSIDLILVGTLGKGGLKRLDRLLLGSVAAKVTHISKIPVLVIPVKPVNI